MGITEKLFLFCNCRTSLQYNCLSCLFLFVYFWYFDMFVNIYCVISSVTIWTIDIVLLLMNLVKIYNKSIWTILSAVFLVFVPAVAASDLVRDIILAANVGPLPQNTTAQTAKIFDAKSNQQNKQNSHKNFKTAGGSFQYSRGLCWTRPIPESISSICA